MTKRRLAIAVIAAAAAATAALGGLYAVSIARDFSDGDEFWGPFFLASGVYALVAGTVCTYLAVRDVGPGRLSARARRWTWAATAGFSLLTLPFLWIPVYLVGPLVTALFVWLAQRSAPRAGSGGGRAVPG